MPASRPGSGAPSGARNLPDGESQSIVGRSQCRAGRASISLRRWSLRGGRRHPERPPARATPSQCRRHGVLCRVLSVPCGNLPPRTVPAAVRCHSIAGARLWLRSTALYLAQRCPTLHMPHPRAWPRAETWR
jgi:hypothetical protein